MHPLICATIATGSEILLQKILDFRQIFEPLEKNFDAFVWRHLSRKSVGKRAMRPKKQMAIVVPYILLASGTASASRVPAPPKIRASIKKMR